MVPEDWKCDFTGVTDNLWLNLSTGTIGSGRQQWDGTGGNGTTLHPLFLTNMHVQPSSACVRPFNWSHSKVWI